MQKKILLIAIVVGIIIGTIASFGWNAYRLHQKVGDSNSKLVEAVTPQKTGNIGNRNISKEVRSYVRQIS
jgi:predicted negative regulator of RcsB-dependent stress response